MERKIWGSIITILTGTMNNIILSAKIPMTMEHLEEGLILLSKSPLRRSPLFGLTSSLPLGPGVGVLGGLVGLDEVATVRAHPHHQGAGHEDRRVDAEDDADGQRQGEIMQRRAAEEEHRQHRRLGAAMRDHGTRHGGRDRVVQDFGGAGFLVFAEIFAGAVEHDHGFVDRIAQDRQHRRQHGQREFPLEEGKEAQNNGQIVEVRDDRRHREPPFKAEGQIGNDTDGDQQHGFQAVMDQFFTDLRPDELDPTQLDAWIGCAQGRNHILGQLRRGHAVLQRQSDDHVRRGAEILHRRFRETMLDQDILHLRCWQRLLEMHLDQRTAGEFDA